MTALRKKGLWIVLALVLTAAAILTVIFLSNRNKVALRQLTVYVDGKEYLTSPLIPGEALTVTQENGAENVIRMTEDGFYMESASCPNQDCIAQGEVTCENWRHRKLLEQVICLPNRVVVALELRDASEAPQQQQIIDLPDI